MTSLHSGYSEGFSLCLLTVPLLKPLWWERLNETDAGSVWLSECVCVCVEQTYRECIWLIEEWIEGEIREKIKENSSHHPSMMLKYSHISDEIKPFPGWAGFLDTNLLLHMLSSTAQCLHMITLGHNWLSLHAQSKLALVTFWSRSHLG